VTYGMTAVEATVTVFVGVPLASGQVVSGLSGASGSNQYFYIDVPPGATSLMVTTAGSGGRGDNADLYVQLGNLPSASAFDCASAGATSTEWCSLVNPAPGRYFILLRGALGYSGVALQASYVISGPGALSLNLAGTASSITAGTGSTTLAVARRGGTLGAATGTLGVAGGCTLSATTVDFAGGSAVPLPATVTVSAGTAIAGSTCTVLLSATGASLGMPYWANIAVAAVPSVGTPLSNGVAVTGLAGAAGSSTFFYIDVPSGATSLMVTTAGAGGRLDNADLYVRLGSLPSAGAFDCASAGGSSSEACSFTNPPAGRYYILLYGAMGYTGLSLQATYVVPALPTPGALALSISSASIGVTTGSTDFSVLRTGGTSGVAAGVLSVTGGCTLSATYVGFADASSTPSPAGVIVSAGSALEGSSCTVTLAAATGAVIGSPSVAYISITSAPPPTGTPLANGQVVGGLSGAAGSSQYFYIDVPANATSLTVQTSGGGRGDNVDLYLRKDTVPTTATYDCRSNGTTNAERCLISFPAAGRHFVMLFGTSAYSGVDLVAAYAAASDSTPDPFYFGMKSGFAPGTVVVSNTIVPTGYSVPAVISVSNGEYSIGCAGTFTAAAGMINPGQSVCVRHTTEPRPGATVITTLTIGGVSGTFLSTPWGLVP
jgi:large repetitive protein